MVVRLAVVGDVQALGAAAWAALSSADSVFVATPGLDAGAVVGPAVSPALDPHRRLGADSVEVIQQPVPTASHWLVVTRPELLGEVLAEHADRMAGADLLLAPGGFGGAIRVRDWFCERGLEPPRIAETTGFPAMGSWRAGAYEVTTVKRRLPFASLDPDPHATENLFSGFRRWLPDLFRSELATTTLANTNSLIHPPLVIANAIRIARGEPFTFYRDGLADEAANLLEGVDAERRAVVRALGGDDRSGLDWMLGFYADQGMAGDDLIAALRSFGPFATTPSPPRLDYRYLTDDIPYGVAAWAALAHRFATPGEHLTALRVLASGLLGRSLEPPAGLVDAVAQTLLTRKDSHVIAST